MLSSSAFPPFPAKRKQSTTDMSYYGPLSPSLHATGSVLKRMNTIAPGPFAVDRRRQNSRGGSRPGTAMSENPPDFPPALPRSATYSHPSPLDKLSQSPESLPGLPVLAYNGHSESETPAAHVSRFSERSNTFPRISAVEPRPDLRRMESIPANPSDHRSVGKPAHFSAESQSSSGSLDTSERRTVSSRSTPPLNEFPAVESSGPTLGPDAVDQLMNKLRLRGNQPLDISQSVEDSKAKEPEPRTSIASKASSRKPSQDHQIPESPVDPTIRIPLPSLAPLQLPSTTFVKPSTAASRSPPVESWASPHYAKASSVELRSPLSDLKSPSVGSEYSPYSEQPPTPLSPPLPAKNPDLKSSSAPSPLIITRPPPTPETTIPKLPPVPEDAPAPLQRRKTNGRRKCRGCDQVIIGKSIASADGRLTGRYHKACFSCKQCQSPFETATFYVHENHPYCARHYHEINGSLCKRCDQGIEGQYLETSQAQKFHQACLTCSDCQRPLQDDYYELAGKALCEAHAFRSRQQTSLLGPGRRHPERRTTRLMTMPVT